LEPFDVTCPECDSDISLNNVFELTSNKKTILNKIKDVMYKEKNTNKVVLKIWNLKLKFFKNCSNEELLFYYNSAFETNKYPYCILNYSNGYKNCLIFNYTNKDCCKQTPYIKIEDFYINRYYKPILNSNLSREKYLSKKKNELIDLIKVEINFLKEVIRYDKLSINDKIQYIIKTESDLNKTTLRIWDMKLEFFKNNSLDKIEKALNIGLFGLRNCPYCEKYIGHSCTDCPIKLYTHKGYCNNTPYEHLCAFLENLRAFNFYNFNEKERHKLIRLVEKEIKFLKEVVDGK